MESDNKQYIVATVDGASSGNPGPGGWAILMDGEMQSGWVKHVTNNQMELMACLMALENCPSYSDMIIETDSTLAIGWLSKNWKCKSPYTKSVLDACKITRDAKCINVKLRKVSYRLSPRHLEVHKVAQRETKIARYTVDQ